MKKIFKCENCDSVVNDSDKFCHNCGSLFDTEENEIISDFVEKVKKQTGVQFSVTRDFGESYYAKIRGENFRISNHAQTDKWASIYGRVSPENQIILYSGMSTSEMKKEGDLFIKRIKEQLKKKEEVVYTSFQKIVMAFKNENDIKKGTYMVYNDFEKKEEKFEIIKVDKENKVAVVNIKGVEREIPFKYVLNWRIPGE